MKKMTKEEYDELKETALILSGIFIGIAMSIFLLL